MNAELHEIHTFLIKQRSLSNGNKTILKNLNQNRSLLSCLISSLWWDCVFLFCRKPLEGTQGCKMNKSFAVAFPRNILFPWPQCFLKSLLCNETTIAITRLINFLMVLYILRADSVYFIFHQVSLSKYSMKTIGIRLFLTNVKFRRRNLKNHGVLPL